MAASASPVRFRAMPLSELLDETFRLYRRHFAVIAALSLVITIPVLIATLLTGVYRFNSYAYVAQALRSISNPGAYENPLPPDPVGVLVIVAVAILMFPFTGVSTLLFPGAGALYLAAADAALGRPFSVGSLLLGALRRYFPTLGLLALAGLSALIGILVITIPLVWWIYVRWTVAGPAFWSEGLGPVRSLGRSWNLVRNQWWRTLGILIVVLILVDVIQFGLGAVFLGIAALLPGVGDDLRAGLVTVANTIVHAVATPITAIAVTLLFFDLRVRQEGLDLEQLAQQTSAGPAPA